MFTRFQIFFFFDIYVYCDIANSLFYELRIMNIQITTRISSLGKLGCYSNHQIKTEYYFCFILSKTN